jgi:hypothetical protein
VRFPLSLFIAQFDVGGSITLNVQLTINARQGGDGTLGCVKGAETLQVLALSIMLRDLHSQALDFGFQILSATGCRPICLILQRDLSPRIIGPLFIDVGISVRLRSKLVQQSMIGPSTRKKRAVGSKVTFNAIQFRLKRLPLPSRRQ